MREMGTSACKGRSDRIYLIYYISWAITYRFGLLEGLAGIDHFYALHHIKRIEYKLGTWNTTCGIIGFHIVAQGAATDMISCRNGQAKMLATATQGSSTGIRARLCIRIEHLHALYALCKVLEICENIYVCIPSYSLLVFTRRKDMFRHCSFSQCMMAL